MKLVIINRIEKSCRIFILSLLLAGGAQAALEVDGQNKEFKAQVDTELQAMRSGKRGVVSQVLVERLDAASATTTIRPLTEDESTWHPNDPRGIRSHVAPVDTKMRGGKRTTPTSVVFFLNAKRINPSLSVFKLGTFVAGLAEAHDLNRGEFDADYRVREKRVIFFRNAWCDSQKFPVVDISGRVPTPEYKKAKLEGLLTRDNAELFPIIESLPPASPVPGPDTTPLQ